MIIWNNGRSGQGQQGSATIGRKGTATVTKLKGLDIAGLDSDGLHINVAGEHGNNAGHGWALCWRCLSAEQSHIHQADCFSWVIRLEGLVHHVHHALAPTLFKIPHLHGRERERVVEWISVVGTERKGKQKNYVGEDICLNI